MQAFSGPQTPRSAAPSSRLLDSMSIGNYTHYYGTRISDDRLKFMDSEWFHNLRVLDVGCNAGAVSLAIANRFQPASVLGIDADPELIKKAFSQCALINSCRTPFCMPSSQTRHGPLLISLPNSTIIFPISMPLLFGTVPLNLPQTMKPANELYRTIDFSVADIIMDGEVLFADEIRRFDAILCLSVTKWIHLTHGDPGIIRLFQTLYRLLSVGGRLIIEPQSWTSYPPREQQQLQLRPFIAGDERDLQHPETFWWHLCHSAGFRSPGKVLRAASEDSDINGFNRRPMWMFQK
jgi:7SK snRNA methylphosphate capping enzyme